MLDIFWVLIVPLLLGLILTTLRAIASQTKITYETSVDIALDMTFLALGAVGGAFYNSKIQQATGRYSIALLMFYILNFLGITARLLYIRRFATETARHDALRNILLGIYACVLDAVVIYLGT
jgi:predicted Na+-dependent transporter